MMPAIYVLDVPEFRALIDLSRASKQYETTDLGNGYFRVRSADTLEFGRKELGFKPAVWYGCITGGIDGTILQFDRDTLRIGPLAP